MKTKLTNAEIWRRIAVAQKELDQLIKEVKKDKKCLKKPNAKKRN